MNSRGKKLTETNSKKVPIHIKLINKTEFNVQVCQSNEEENGFFCEMIPPRESSIKSTFVGWTFEFVGAFGNLLYVSLNDNDGWEFRSIQFKPTPVQGPNDAANPLPVYIHKSRFPVEPDLTSVDPRGRPLHSDAGEPSYVSFINASHKTVGAFWFNYQGIRVHYGDIPSGDAMQMDTFETHPWIFVDADNFEMLTNISPQPRMYRDSSPHLFPPAWSDHVRRFPVVIHSRVHSLKALALTVVRKRVEAREMELTKEIVPASLIEEVKTPLPQRGFLSLDEQNYFNSFD
jgi:hypothetical protein